ncbi:MAG: hypothetical protein ACI9MU_000001, partial [Alphaproteobacteria bacterium]
MPLLKRFSKISFNAASGASILALLPFEAWAQDTHALSGTWPYEQA